MSDGTFARTRRVVAQRCLQLSGMIECAVHIATLFEAQSAGTAGTYSFHGQMNGQTQPLLTFTGDVF